MRASLLSIRWRNAYGNVGSGVCLLALGISLCLGSLEAVGLISAVLLFLCAGMALYACVSRDGEGMDEMALANEGRAAALAVKVTLALLGLMAVFGMLSGTQVSLGALSCLSIGAALAGYGLAFAWLERN